jgi:hypothetical protein
MKNLVSDFLDVFLPGMFVLFTLFLMCWILLYCWTTGGALGQIFVVSAVSLTASSLLGAIINNFMYKKE